jgi:hypothetical protein
LHPAKTLLTTSDEGRRSMSVPEVVREVVLYAGDPTNRQTLHRDASVIGGETTPIACGVWLDYLEGRPPRMRDLAHARGSVVLEWVLRRQHAHHPRGAGQGEGRRAVSRRAGLIIALLACLAMAPLTCAGRMLQLQEVWAGPFVPEHAVRVSLDSFPRWRKQYAAAEECLGFKGNADSVAWHVVEADHIKASDGRRDLALWVAPHSIYIARPFVNLEWVIRHESLHDIIGNGIHPTGVFGTLCGATWATSKGTQ